MTASMLSLGWSRLRPLSKGSVLTGVAGGERSRTEFVLARDNERAMEIEELDERVPECTSEEERERYPAGAKSVPREAMVSLTFKKWRISMLRWLRSSLVIPMD
jgi:hypothetical protein